MKCNRRFTTFETIETSFQIKKRDGSFQDFSSEKLIAGISSACRHTSVSKEAVKALCHTLVSDILQKGERVVDAEEIGEMVMKELRALDSVAYIRFACVYKKFKDMDELMAAISSAS
jgi:transcriptional repressor NrdR